MRDEFFQLELVERIFDESAESFRHDPGAPVRLCQPVSNFPLIINARFQVICAYGPNHLVVSISDRERNVLADSLSVVKSLPDPKLCIRFGIGIWDRQSVEMNVTI